MKKKQLSLLAISNAQYTAEYLFSLPMGIVCVCSPSRLAFKRSRRLSQCRLPLELNSLYKFNCSAKCWKLLQLQLSTEACPGTSYVSLFGLCFRRTTDYSIQTILQTILSVQPAIKNARSQVVVWRRSMTFEAMFQVFNCPQIEQRHSNYIFCDKWRGS